MISEIKAASDTCLHQHESKSISLLPIELLSCINSDNVLHYRSGNNYSSKRRIQTSVESINENYQKFSNKNLINSHFPIANIQKKDLTIVSKTSSSQLPTVPKQAGTFIHRLVNTFFSITNTNQNKKTFKKIKRKNNLSPIKRIKQKQIDTSLNTRILSTDNNTFSNITSKRRKRRQRSKIIINNNNNKHCAVCRKYRNYFSILPMNKRQCLPTDSLEYTSESPLILNANATRTQRNNSVLINEPSISTPKIHLQKLRNLNKSQCQTIASAVELIFDTLISNYEQV